VGGQIDQTSGDKYVSEEASNTIKNNLFNYQRQNKNFIGREAFITRISEKFISANQGDCVIQCLTGMGGIGKTQLALQFAIQQSDNYDLIWWLRAEDPSLLSVDFASLSEPLQIKGAQAMDRDRLMVEILSVLNKRDDWMLIFDNADAPTSIAQFLPNKGGKVLITSQNQNWREVADVIPVSLFSPDESLQFIQQRTGLTEAEQSIQLAFLLGHLPVALTQATSFISEAGISISEYNELFIKHAKVLYEDTPSINEQSKSLLTTLELSLNRLQSFSPLSISILKVIAFFSPYLIPKRLLRIAFFLLTDEEVDAKSDLEFIKAVGSLSKFSLIEQNNEAVSIHHLVQLLIRENMVKSEQLQWGELALESVDRYFKYRQGAYSRWPRFFSALPHVIQITALASQMVLNVEKTSRLINEVGLFFGELHSHEIAHQFFLKALDLKARHFGRSSIEVSTALSNLGLTLVNIGQYESGRKHLIDSLEICKNFPEHKFPDYSSGLNNLGLALKGLCRFQEAIDAFEEAIKINKEQGGLAHPSVARVKINIAMVHKDLENPSIAIKYLNEALSIFENKTVEESDKLLLSVGNYHLGLLLFENGQIDLAITHMEKALENQREIYDFSHPTFQDALFNLGAMKFKAEKYDEAEFLLEEYLENVIKSEGYLSRESSSAFEALGMILIEVKNYTKAKSCFENCMKIRRELCGEISQPFASAIGNLGLLSLRMKSYAAAKKHFNKAVEISRLANPNDSKHVLEMLYKTAELYLMHGKHKESKRYTEMANELRANSQTNLFQIRNSKLHE